MTTVMYDSILVDLLPAGDFAFAGYVDGYWPTYADIVSKFPDAQVLSVAVSPDASADCLDVETGDATDDEILSWYDAQIAGGAVRPCIYTDAANMSAVQTLLQGKSFRMWSAHYTYEAHICAPGVCGYGIASADATQWTDLALNEDLDQSLLSADFFSIIPAGWQEIMMAQLPTLSNGSDDKTLPHEYVARVQLILSDIFGYKLTIDGDFGPKTEAAVEELEKAKGLTVDGIVGPEVWQELYLGELNGS